MKMRFLDVKFLELFFLEPGFNWQLFITYLAVDGLERFWGGYGTRC